EDVARKPPQEARRGPGRVVKTGEALAARELVQQADVLPPGASPQAQRRGFRFGTEPVRVLLLQARASEPICAEREMAAPAFKTRGRVFAEFGAGIHRVEVQVGRGRERREDAVVGAR